MKYIKEYVDFDDFDFEEDDNSNLKPGDKVVPKSKTGYMLYGVSEKTPYIYREPKEDKPSTMSAYKFVVIKNIIESVYFSCRGYFNGSYGDLWTIFKLSEWEKYDKNNESFDFEEDFEEIEESDKEPRKGIFYLFVLDALEIYLTKIRVVKVIRRNKDTYDYIKINKNKLGFGTRIWGELSYNEVKMDLEKRGDGTVMLFNEHEWGSKEMLEIYDDYFRNDYGDFPKKYKEEFYLDMYNY